MSNILTSYLRIFRRDNRPLDEKEINFLFENSVRAYGGFGSYWVRINKKYRELERCLDIQFGCSKTEMSEDIFEKEEVFEKYMVWERESSDSGSNDSIRTYERNEESGYILSGYGNDCKYGFDRIKIEAPILPVCLKNIPLNLVSAHSYELEIKGSYYACNSRSCQDLNENFSGPCLQYDPIYESDYFTLTKDGGINEVDTDFLKELIVFPYENLTVNCKIELFWNNRLVHKIYNVDGVQSSSADYWDNCLDENYLHYVEQRG